MAITLTPEEFQRHWPEQAAKLAVATDGKPAIKVRIPVKNALGMNKTEERASRFFDHQKSRGVIREHSFETMKFRLADRRWYTPDYAIILPDYTLILAEIKGSYIREDGMLKLQIAAEQLSFPFFLCVYDNRKWTVRRMPSRSSRAIDIDVFDGM